MSTELPEFEDSSMAHMRPDQLEAFLELSPAAQYLYLEARDIAIAANWTEGTDS